MKIEIVKIEGCFDVRIGDKRTGVLSWDEMLGQIAKLTLTGERLYAMNTEDERAAVRANWKAASVEEQS